MKHRAALAGLAVLAAVAGAGAAASLPAAASVPGETPRVQVFSVPANLLPSAPGWVTDAALAPAADGAGEEFVVSGAGPAPVALEASSAGQITAPQPGSQLGTTPFVAMLNADGFAWALSGSGLYAIGPDGIAHPFTTPTGASFTDMALGLDGKLYLADHNGSIDRCVITPAPSASCTESFAFASSPAGASLQSRQLDAIASAGSNLWFTTDAFELGSMTTSSTFTAYPHDDNANAATGDGTLIGPASAYAHSLTLGNDGKLYAVGSIFLLPTQDLSGTPSAIVQIAADTGHANSMAGTVLKYYDTGLPASAMLTSLTTGPDGDIWFTEELPGGGGEIGQLDPTTGIITNYPLPSGYALAGAGADSIQPGPLGSETVWFAARSTASPASPAIGEVSGVGAPPPSTTTITTTTSTPPPTTTTKPPPVNHLPTVTIGATATASSRGRAAVKLECIGTAGTTCAGQLALSRTVVTHRSVKLHGHWVRRTKRETITLGSAGYSVGAGNAITVQVKLTREALTMLGSAPHRQLAVTSIATASDGLGASASVTLSAPEPKHAAKR